MLATAATGFATGGPAGAVHPTAGTSPTVAAPSVGAFPGSPGADRPNILFVLADDMDLPLLAAMPNVRRLVAEQGSTLTDFYVSSASCCPSRTTTLRGQFAHNTGVKSNGGTNGGFDTAHRLHVEDDTIATRLQRAGYRTGLFGKYLNKYPGTAGAGYVPPGWTRWVSPVAGQPYSGYNYTLSVDGAPETHGDLPSDYATDVLVDHADAFVEQSVAAGQPFFAYVAPFTPHFPSIPAPVDVGTFAGATAPRTPSFDQRDVSAMPALIRNAPRLGTEELAAMDRHYEMRLEALQSIDRGVGRLIDTLQADGALDRTYVVFTSDNGYHIGQHRLPAGKETPYDTDVHMPFVVRGPGIAAGSTVAEMTMNVDLAPTFAAMAGIHRWSAWDGHSLLPALTGHPTPPARRRTAMLLEHWAVHTVWGRPSFTPWHGRAVTQPDEEAEADPRLRPTYIPEPSAMAAVGGDSLHGEGDVDVDHAVLGDEILYALITPVPDFRGVRTDRYLYVEYVNGDRELYDAVADPDQMHNLAGTRPGLEHRLAARLAALRHCAGRTCRAAERAPAGP